MRSDIEEADPPQPRAVIFESYGWGDAGDIARQVKGSLEEAGFEVWIDSEHISPHDPHFWLAVEGALNKCELVVARSARIRSGSRGNSRPRTALACATTS